MPQADEWPRIDMFFLYVLMWQTRYMEWGCWSPVVYFSVWEISGFYKPYEKDLGSHSNLTVFTAAELRGHVRLLQAYYELFYIQHHKHVDMFRPI